VRNSLPIVRVANGLVSRFRAYTVSMKTVVLLLFFFALQTHSALGQDGKPSDSPQMALETGVVIPKVVCSDQPEQSYALYLPKHYAPDRRWPVVYVFDPGARGKVPVEIMKDAAERSGFIVAGSNNSRNGPWKLEREAAQAMMKDVQTRLAIESRSSYFAGFSGGARASATIAQLCQCAAGVLLSGAGFRPSSPPSREANFPVFSAVGTYDFNFPEMVRLDAKLESLGYAHFLRQFDGPHQWAPSAVMNEAFAWFRLLAMKEGREPRDDSFVAAQERLADQRALALETSGDLYSAWKEYRQAINTFAGLTDSTSLKTRAQALESNKAVREGPKREEGEFDEQQRLTQEISNGMAALAQNPTNRDDVRFELEQQIVALRSRSIHEKREEKLRVVKRALADVFANAMETGEARLEAGDVSLAREYFQLACDANPESAWALGDLALAKARDGDRKGAMEALRHAREKTKDPVAFSEWLEEEPGFAKFRDSAEFRALLLPIEKPQGRGNE
jgi:tetratricopeptide (TPR) repeat protein